MRGRVCERGTSLCSAVAVGANQWRYALPGHMCCRLSAQHCTQLCKEAGATNTRGVLQPAFKGYACCKSTIAGTVLACAGWVMAYGAGMAFCADGPAVGTYKTPVAAQCLHTDVSWQQLLLRAALLLSSLCCRRRLLLLLLMWMFLLFLSSLAVPLREGLVPCALCVMASCLDTLGVATPIGNVPAVLSCTPNCF